MHQLLRPAPLHTGNALAWLLVSCRKSLKLSQAQVATRVGVSQSRISYLEQNPEEISVKQLLAWCSVLGLELQLGALPRNDEGTTTPSGTPESGKPPAW